MDPELLKLLKPHLHTSIESVAEPFKAVSHQGIDLAAQTLGRPAREIMRECLTEGIWPERFSANRGTFSNLEQACLLGSRVAVIGAGGLGGMVVLQLARLGVGELTVCDGDMFEESNLNRQFLAVLETLGRGKAQVAAEAVARMNPAVQVNVVTAWAGGHNLPAILAGNQMAVDCLDNLPARYALEKAASQAKVPYVHGAVAGLEGMVMTVLPGEPGLVGLYGPEPAARRDSAEALMGMPTTTPAAVATLQVNEVVKLLLGGRGLGPGQVLHLDLSRPSLEVMSLEPSGKD